METASKKTYTGWRGKPTIILAILLMGGTVFFLAARFSFDKYIAENCPTYTYSPGFIDAKEFIDCKGVIGIEKFGNEEYLTVFNELYRKRVRANQSRELGAGSDWDAINLWNYTLVGDELFYLEDPQLNDGKPLYHSVTEWPQDVDILSRYRKLNTTTARFTLYKTLEEIPGNERAVFAELEFKVSPN